MSVMSLLRKEFEFIIVVFLISGTFVIDGLDLCPIVITERTIGQGDNNGAPCLCPGFEPVDGKDLECPDGATCYGGTVVDPDALCFTNYCHFDEPILSSCHCNSVDIVCNTSQICGSASGCHRNEGCKDITGTYTSYLNDKVTDKCTVTQNQCAANMMCINHGQWELIVTGNKIFVKGLLEHGTVLEGRIEWSNGGFQLKSSAVRIESTTYILLLLLSLYLV